MHKKLITVLVAVVSVAGAWLSVDVGQFVVVGPDSIQAKAILFNRCNISPLRTTYNAEPDYAIIDGCDPIDPSVDLCPNLAGIQVDIPAGYEIDAAGNCVVPPPTDIDVCPNIAGVQASVPAGYQFDAAGNCVLIPPPAVQPTCTLVANPSSVSIGNGANLSWTTANGDAFWISGVGTVTPTAGGSVSVIPLVTTTYTGTVINANGFATCTATLSISADALNNGGFEQSGTSATNAYDWQEAYQSTYARVQAPHSGSWSLRLQNATVADLSGAYQRIDLQQTSVKPVFVGGYVKGSGVVMAPGSWIGASLYAEVYYTDGTVGYVNSIPNAGTFDWRWIGFNTGTMATQKPIDHIFVVPILAFSSGTVYFDDIAVAQIEPQNKSAVTIMFDDGEENTFTAAKPALDAYGYPASTVIIADEIGQPGFMTTAQIQSLVYAGWEVISHGITHSDLTLLSPTEWQQELSQSKTILQGLGYNVHNFAPPFGAYNADIIGYGQHLYSSLRPFEAGDNPQGVFPYAIKSRQVTSATTPADVAAWVQEGKSGNRWEVLVFHSVAASADDIYFTTPATFGQMLAAIAQSGVPVVTYNEGLMRFATIGGPTPATPILNVPPPPQPPTPPDPVDPCASRFSFKCYLLNLQ